MQKNDFMRSEFQLTQSMQSEFQPTLSEFTLGKTFK